MSYLLYYDNTKELKTSLLTQLIWLFGDRLRTRHSRGPPGRYQYYSVLPV